MWIMDHSVGVDVVLETNFRILAGMRLDLFHGIARLPDKVVVPLVKSAGAANEEPYGVQTISGPTEVLYVLNGESFDYLENNHHVRHMSWGSEGPDKWYRL
ncbi:LOW QUALITY PROTEIN: hypothetical protein PHMEG_00017506 [Phytophthora megakarya]|uniref:Uncharacterized protein n=1 Tax=Phytophthora megakarya TaxID=4795 RepID=A0A225VWC4_9STRA|nr:LOW QUALITY PROTEIN: hypothetical protein PHMEG_00017506 [Phytophthora megakarya]